MKKLILSIFSTIIFSNLAFATEADQSTISTEKTTPHFGVCLVNDIPSQQYVVIKHVKVAKGNYGSVQDLYPKLGKVAQQLNADAIVNYNASQRFGFWPWRIVRPVATGTAVKWTSTQVNCTSLGGVEI
ncbi:MULTISPECIES: hypothetical protein [Acinetobacter]|uniref:Uncharacterized protein n=1 Tax=Acinetobacter baylyi (strain ATCC 33305 / BD413 / ADP1) TaxID=62977 RepID=Q6F8P1_ACIAD|nr:MULTISPECIES: hypothetical protein [Acinetobacter]ENV53494.1 hypothetical protein F952_02556 [Acinetobacter baylyi DSM 14961 = CIP 107474]KAF2370835.1 peptide signal protein [Acinetobacter baylyi]KAF2375029.1 peptide signal protein [Acinetobacter baylyi]KAF2378374.1 peptide signal protein [Acinetobacter baylyi]KAF2380133.1 peptide signal protein [Acinetobacter baylyi]